MLLPKFDILNKIKRKNHTCKCDNYRICCFVFTVLQTLGIVNLFLLGYGLFVDYILFFRYDNLGVLILQPNIVRFYANNINFRLVLFLYTH